MRESEEGQKTRLWITSSGWGGGGGDGVGGGSNRGGTSTFTTGIIESNDLIF